jgi:hypothetical protein
LLRRLRALMALSGLSETSACLSAFRSEADMDSGMVWTIPVAHESDIRRFAYSWPEDDRPSLGKRVQAEEDLMAETAHGATAEKAELKSFGKPDDVRTFPKGRLELVNIGEAAATARNAAAVRVSTPSFSNTCSRCFWTVRGLIASNVATSPFVFPAATRARTSRSRAVSGRESSSRAARPTRSCRISK